MPISLALATVRVLRSASVEVDVDVESGLDDRLSESTGRSSYPLGALVRIDHER
jgi:hypothetical protein